MKRLKLPIGIQAFETMRTQGYVYVDKTQDIHRMVTEGMFYFMARPRRFGKSLTVSSLRCLFRGWRELFEGLWLAEHGEWDWQAHPVLLLDFNLTTHDTPENLRQSLEWILHNTAQTHQIKLEHPLLKGQFEELILALRQKTGQPVVVLIDEYDKPLIDHLGRGEAALDTARANRDLLKGFFGVLKGGDVSPALRLVFITGVSRFSRVSIFSELNNLNDLSMHPDYAEMMGYTQTELESYFRLYLDQLASKLGYSKNEIKEALATKYDGYRFSTRGSQVYNPFSVLKAFSHKQLGNYWFETGTPTFLVNLLQEQQYHLPQIENLTVSETLFSSYDLDNLRPEALLFQTGYLTIKDVQDRLYTLDYPNQEVKLAFLETLLLALTEGSNRTDRSKFVKLASYLHQEQFDSFFETITAIFASIPYDIATKRDEAYFHTLFYLMVSASGGNAHSSVLTSRGRIDLVVEFKDKVYIIEFKCNQSPATAIRQIKAQGYADPYRQSGKKVILLGLDFSPEERNVSEWKVEIFG